jgi:phosphoserine/homoserine phosphotransferase
LFQIKKRFQVVILSDTFHDIAKPLMEKLGFPFLLCHNFRIKNDEIISYKLRHPKAKKQAIYLFKKWDIDVLQQAILIMIFKCLKLQKKDFL